MTSSLTDSERTQLNEALESLRLATQETAAATGGDFFQLLAQHLAQSLHARYSFVAECTDATKTHVRTLAFWIEELFSPGFEQNRLHLDLLLSLILMESEGQAVNPQKDLLRHVNTFIQGRMADPLTLEDLAHHVNKSKFHFSRIFKQETGRSPMSYLRDFRVRAAQLLLATTTLPLKAIAQQVGFRDEFHFSRIYKRATGHPPGATRRKSML